MRIVADKTSLKTSGKTSGKPRPTVAIDGPAGFRNVAVHAHLLSVFGPTDSRGVKDRMDGMGEAVLAATPEIGFAMPNTHAIPIDLVPFGLENPGTVFPPTGEPHGQIVATIGRG